MSMAVKAPARHPTPRFIPSSHQKRFPLLAQSGGGAPVVFVEPAGVALPAATAVRTMPKFGRSASHSHCRLETIVLDALPFAQRTRFRYHFLFLAWQIGTLFPNPSTRSACSTGQTGVTPVISRHIRSVVLDWMLRCFCTSPASSERGVSINAGAVKSRP